MFCFFQLYSTKIVQFNQFKTDILSGKIFLNASFCRTNTVGTEVAKKENETGRRPAEQTNY
jgi:hypothetical protein